VVFFDCGEKVTVVIKKHAGQDERHAAGHRSRDYCRSDIKLYLLTEVKTLPIAVKLKFLSGLLRTFTSVDSRPITEFNNAGLSSS
jgi:hypothetical protein